MFCFANVQMRSYWIRVYSKSNHSVRKRDMQRYIRKEDGHVTMEIKIGVM